MAKLSQQYQLGSARVPCRRGNLHPLIIFDMMKPGDFDRARPLAPYPAVVRQGRWRALGEHGVGVEKRDLMTEMFSSTDLEQQGRVKCAFDAQGRSIRQGVSHAVSPVSSRAISMSRALSCRIPICRVTDGQGGDQTQVIEFVRAARADKAPFEIVAGGTRRSVGRPLLIQGGGDLPCWMSRPVRYPHNMSRKN